MKKQTKGLKKSLTPRKKTMKQEDIIYDFGMLGKHKESYLKANTRISDPFIVSKDAVKTINNYRIFEIDLYADVLKVNHKRILNKLLNKRYIFPRFKTIAKDITIADNISNKLDTLNRNYALYKQTIERLSKKKND
jgi:hypothetical protein